jgi:type II secretory pathway pseudopilin PulG
MSRRSARRAERGMTLLELVVALGISMLTIAAAMTLLIQQQRAYAVTSGDRAQQEAGRLALQELLDRLKAAAYGVDPNLALDFGPTTVAPRSGLAPPATMVGLSSYRCADPVLCRDKVDGSDEIVFYSRDPWFRRLATKVDVNSLELLGDLKVPLAPGQILQVSCMGGGRVRAYVTVGAYHAAAATPDATKKVHVTLAAGVQAGGREVFPNENAQLKDGCFNLNGVGNEVYVTSVDRYRYYVAWYRDGKVITAAADRTQETRPYLMLDQGLTGADGAAVLLPVAPDVEDLQFAYYYPPAAAGGAPRVVGADPGTNAADEAFKMQVDVIPPAMDDLSDNPTRLTGHPANIQAVRVSAVVRQPEVDIGIADAEGAWLPAAGNRPAQKAPPYRRRALFETTVVLRNMGSTYFTYPVN